MSRKSIFIYPARIRISHRNWGLGALPQERGMYGNIDGTLFFVEHTVTGANATCKKWSTSDALFSPLNKRRPAALLVIENFVAVLQLYV